jgi:hypothetical protein
LWYGEKVSEGVIRQNATHQKVTVAEVARENTMNMGAAVAVEHIKYQGK